MVSGPLRPSAARSDARALDRGGDELMSAGRDAGGSGGERHSGRSSAQCRGGRGHGQRQAGWSLTTRAAGAAVAWSAVLGGVVVSRHEKGGGRALDERKAVTQGARPAAGAAAGETSTRMRRGSGRRV